ncbi:unnamed protein product [Clonostachys rosea f. rosea IK726]|uniref:Uncharacterized protein n=1 Tax=Clonostachys rosea f. rosea IK726 TaxID=1349383 RepID=A0ACA9UMK2_BIOOC|nr:unnamed protein product [Clonostachys rosea f. rosea IK726]
MVDGLPLAAAAWSFVSYKGLRLLPFSASSYFNIEPALTATRAGCPQLTLTNPRSAIVTSTVVTMPKKDHVLVPYEEIRRLLDGMDSRRVINRTQPVERPSKLATPRPLPFEEGNHQRKEPLRVSPREATHVSEDTDRQGAEGPALQEQKAVNVPSEELRRTLKEMDRRRSERRLAMPRQRTDKKKKVSEEDFRRTLESLECQRREERIQSSSRTPSRTAPVPCPKLLDDTSTSGQKSSRRQPSPAARVRQPTIADQVESPPQTPSWKRPREENGFDPTTHAGGPPSQKAACGG